MNRHIIIIGLAILIMAATVHGLVPRTTFNKPDQLEIRACDRWDLLVVKFVEGSDVRLREGRFISRNNADLTDTLAVLNQYPGTRFHRLFSRPETDYELEKIAGETRTGRELADLNLYYALGPTDRLSALWLLNDLNTLDLVECIYPEPIPEVAVMELPDILTPPDFEMDQEYLGPSPVGVDAYSAWNVPGGRGEFAQFIDVELAWLWTHHDLPDPFYLGGNMSPDVSYRDHGTAVMAEVVGQDNESGVIGIAPETAAGGVAIDINDYPGNLASWFDMASAALEPGDVWLIELHAPGPGGSYICMEWWQGNYDAIANSTAQGRVCIQAAGNGGADFDDPIYEGKFNRSVRDSLAVIVAAGTPYSMYPEYFTCYGSRIDANGWGSQIVTAGYGDLYSAEGENFYYTDEFGGTSGASPMVAGVSCVAQSVYRDLTGGSFIDPETLRAAITETGAPQPDPVYQYIGTRPDLNLLLQHPVFNVNGVFFDRPVYACMDAAVLTVRDETASGSVTVEISSETEPVPEIIILSELEPGLFQGNVALIPGSPTPGDGQVSVNDGDIITAFYAPLSSTAEVLTDCVPPVISDVTVTALTDITALIHWTTDEPATSTVTYGETVPDQIAEEMSLKTDHEILLENLTGCTDYIFEVMCGDSAGNICIDSNEGAYYAFTTMERMVQLNASMDTNPGWEITGGLWGFGEPTGQGGQYGYSDPWSGFTGANVYGYNLNGDYTNNMPRHHLITSGIDMTYANGSILEFYRWLGVESPDFDHASISISTDQESWETVWENTGEIMDDAWVHVKYDISEWADGEPTIYIRWTMGETDSGWTYCGWNIDDVEVSYFRVCGAPTATPQPSATPKPGTPTPAPPTATPTTTPTPFCQNPGVTLEMPSHLFSTGDPCRLTARACRPGSTTEPVLMFVFLDVYGAYWFAPDWSQTPSWYDLNDIPPGSETTITVLEPFTWPVTGSTASDLYFHGALTDMAITRIIGTADSWEFGFRD